MHDYVLDAIRNSLRNSAANRHFRTAEKIAGMAHSELQAWQDAGRQCTGHGRRADGKDAWPVAKSDGMKSESLYRKQIIKDNHMRSPNMVQNLLRLKQPMTLVSQTQNSYGSEPWSRRKITREEWWRWEKD